MVLIVNFLWSFAAVTASFPNFASITAPSAILAVPTLLSKIFADVTLLFKIFAVVIALSAIWAVPIVPDKVSKLTAVIFVPSEKAALIRPWVKVNPDPETVLKVKLKLPCVVASCTI